MRKLLLLSFIVSCGGDSTSSVDARLACEKIEDANIDAEKRCRPTVDLDPGFLECFQYTDKELSEGDPDACVADWAKVDCDDYDDVGWLNTPASCRTVLDALKTL
jgi:hypothetical protein